MATQAITTCCTAAEVRACTARVSAFRARVWPARRPGLPARAPVPPAPKPVIIHEPDPDNCGRILVRDVIEAAAVHFGVTVDALLGPSKRQPIAGQRQVVMYLACRLTGRGLPFIGCIMGNRDHTTVLHGFRRVKARIDAGDVVTIDSVNAIAAKLTGGAHVR